ncbi:MAG TPA: hypothetical protein VH165_14185 [Kofleriaceae bacterium]|nr:hypothetical protein [Kofleriaceae bacterium]
MSLVGVVMSVVPAVMLATERPVRADGIVLESYTGGRPDDVAKYVSPILDELSKHGFVAGYDAVGRKFEASASRPAVTSAGLPRTFRADVERGHDEWARGKFDDALKILTPLVEAAHANQGAFVQEPGLRDALQEALIALALSRKGQGDPDGMNQAFAELVRAFPTATPGPNYGPDANRAFEAVRRDLTGPRAGKLTVRVSDETLGVYVDEQLEGMGITRKPATAPGEYRVVAKSPRGLSRSHRVIVHAGEESTVTIDMSFDQAVHIAADWTGLTFASAADREQIEGAYAAQFANAIDAHAVAVVGTEVVQGRTVIVGALINLVNGRDLRRASIPTDSAPQVDRLRALAKFLAGEDPGRGIEVLINGDGSGPPIPLTLPPRAASASRDAGGPAGREQPDDGARWGGWKWIAGGATVAAIGTGAVLTVLNGRCSTKAKGPTLPCPSQYETLGAGLGTLGGGAVLAGITLYLWVTGAPAAPTRTAYVVPTDGGALAGFATRF